MAHVYPGGRSKNKSLFDSSKNYPQAMKVATFPNPIRSSYHPFAQTLAFHVAKKGIFYLIADVHI
jgi:hypothetical protein